MSKVDVNPKILRWARKSAGLDYETAAKKIGLGNLKDLPSPNRLKAIEDGAEMPTRALLVRMANQYRRPLLTFYLAEPPNKGDRGQDFRQLPPDHPDEPNAWLDTLIRDALARQSLVRNMLEDEDEAADLPFIGSLTMENGATQFAHSIRKALKLDIEQYRATANNTEAFAFLRAKAEQAGIFVLLKGDLGNYRTAIDVETFRGFALADSVAPFVVINDNDARSAWSFTLLHELTHLWLGQTGVSGARAEIAVEKFCNDVAGDILLPVQELAYLNVHSQMSIEVAEQRISEFANVRRVSRSMVAYRLFRANVIDQDLWSRLRSHFRTSWVELRESQRKKNKSKSGGPSYFVVKRHRVGQPLISLVERMMATGAISTSKAGLVLDVRPLNVHKLVRGNQAA